MRRAVRLATSRQLARAAAACVLAAGAGALMAAGAADAAATVKPACPAAAVSGATATVPIRSPTGCWWPAGAVAAVATTGAPPAGSLRGVLAGTPAPLGQQAHRLSECAAKRCPARAAAGPARPLSAGPAVQAIPQAPPAEDRHPA